LLLTRPSAEGNAHHDSSWRHLHERGGDERERAHGKHLYDLRDDSRFYPVTLTDDNGTATFAVGLGVDNGPQVTTVAGNSGTVAGANSTVSVTGTFLNNSVVSIEPVTGSVAPTLVAGSTF